MKYLLHILLIEPNSLKDKQYQIKTLKDTKFEKHV